MLTRKMKDSDIEWIGEIPNDFNSSRLKDIFYFSKGINASLYTKEVVKESGKYPVYSGQTKNEGIMGYLDSYEYDVKESLFTTTVGAKVMTTKILKGRFSLSQNCLIMSQKNHNYEIRFINYFLISLFDYEKALIPTYMQPSLRIEDLLTYKVFSPDYGIQKKIATLLDNKLKSIDMIIFDTQKSIIELKKYKQSIIIETVTKGLDKNVEKKDSGIEWIGKIPEEWALTKLNNLFEIKKVISKELGYDVLSVTQNGLKVKNIDSNSGQMSADYSKYQVIGKEDFVMNHMDLLTGWVDKSEFIGVTSPDYRVFKAKDKLDIVGKYYLYIFQICYLNKIFYGLGQGVSHLGRWRLQTDTFLNFYLPLPSTLEQQQIVDYLDEKTSKIDGLIKGKVQIIKEYEEYKKSLIYEYVTGKKQV